MTNQEIIQMLEARQHVAELHAEHDADLHRWAVRRRRYESFRRVALAACIFAVVAFNAETAYAQPTQYKTITLEGNLDQTQTIDAIEAALHKQ